MKTLAPEFTFAGFTWPRYVVSLPKGSLAARLAASKKPQLTGGYYNAPKPNRDDRGMGFYLGENGSPFSLRWQWCDDVAPRIGHLGWYCDNDYDQKIRGVVFRLPNKRGFLAGWSMGEGMSSGIGATIYDDELEAAREADRGAQQTANDEKDAAEDERQREADEEKAALAAAGLEGLVADIVEELAGCDWSLSEMTALATALRAGEETNLTSLINAYKGATTHG